MYSGGKINCLSLIFLLIVLAGCNPTKYVPEKETLLDRNEIRINSDDIKKSAIEPYIRQKPNDRIFGARFYLGLYNLSNIEKTKWPHGWLRQIGEAPVIFDRASASRSSDQIKSYIASKGYFDSRVRDSIKTTDSKTMVYYNINLLPPYTIRNIHFEVTDSIIREYFAFDSVNCLVRRGQPYDVDILQQERARFERYIRDLGYYAFSQEYITFDVDSTVGNRKIDIYYNVRNTVSTDVFGRVTVIPHELYKIRRIFIYPDYDPGQALQHGDEYIAQLDTSLYEGYYFITSRQDPAIRYDLILQALYLKPGSDYSLTNTEQTQAGLRALNAYRLVNIKYDETEDRGDVPGNARSLDCNIMLTLHTPQSYRVELEGTHTSGNIGGAMNLVYQNRNLFHGAELFSAKLSGSYEALSQEGRLRSIRELGAETSLRLPQFLLPLVRKEGFIKKYNPSTSILAAFNYQEMPLFTRTLATATFGYNWRAGKYQTHIVNPLQLNFVKLPEESIDPVFRRRIESSFQAFSYRDVLILGGGYSFIYNTQSIQRSRAESDQYVFLRFNFETAGNLNSLIDVIRGARKVGDTTFNFLGQPYAQYVRGDIDLRYNYRFNLASSIVYRGFLGVGIPYGNSRAMPFEKQYFGGGANSIRAWRVRSLGPGSYDAVGDTGQDTLFLNQTADIKIELNAEYRFNLIEIFSMMVEGAIFVDAGNIWTYNSDPARPGTSFSFRNTSTTNAFYRDFAIGTGGGLRFDFNFVIARLDLGIKVRDPKEGEGWIIGNRPLGRRDLSLVLGIGYPF